MKRIPIICFVVAVVNSLLIAIDSGSFYQEQLYSESFSFLYLGFITSFLIECMIGLLFALAMMIKGMISKTLLIFLGSLILILSFVSSSAHHVLPRVNEIFEIQNKKEISSEIDSELKRGQDTQKWLKEKNQKLNTILQERHQKKLFEEFIQNKKAEKSAIVPIIITVLIVALKFLMQITAAIFFALSGHYSDSPLLKLNKLNESGLENKSENTFTQNKKDNQFTTKEPGIKTKKTASSSKDNTARKKDFTENNTDYHKNIEGLDLKGLKKQTKLTNRSIAQELGLKECVVSNAMNKSGEIFNFLKNELNNSSRRNNG